ncbi:MAG TPA: STAS domain-containing protein, partial [Burkholderiaceae bacterium]
SETALFIFALKQPVFRQLQAACGRNADAVAAAIWQVTALLDRLGLYTIGVFQKSREEIIQRQQRELAELSWTISTLLDKLGLHTIELFQKTRDQIIVRQQQELLELSTPVVKLWQNVLALPLIGTLDSARTQVVMESLLQKIVETGAAIAIIDITGVPTVDTLVAQHLMKTIAAARLMGADCIISGIRPQIAQTIVHLGVNLEDVVTKATLADAFMVALERTGARISVQA